MAKILVKAGVVPNNLIIMAAVANVAAGLKEPASVTITSGIEGCHKVGSRHYLGNALDVRSHDFLPIAKDAFLKAVLARLGSGYSGFLEAAGTPNEHWHIQFGGLL